MEQFKRAEKITKEQTDFLEPMRAFRCLRLRIEAKATGHILLPPYLGSTLRGAFGMALLRSACALRRQKCPTCLLRARCIYSYTFETSPMNGSEADRRYGTAPHPFVLNLETGREGVQEAGSTFHFGMTLVGRAIDFLPYFVFAFQRMGELGIGKGRGTFEVVRVWSLDSRDDPQEILYENEVLRMPGEFPGLDHALALSGSLSSRKVRLRFITPLRLVYEGELCTDPPRFHVLARNLLRRLNNLVAFHCEGNEGLCVGPLLDRAETVRLTDRSTAWYDWERYSKRQDKRMKMGGFVGDMTFEGDLEQFLPLLVLGSWVNLGKGTSFGLGRYSLAPLEGHALAD
ncbi:MAG TPA: CRISPR system precrRNA processing endoribonuclease RAMP protein Cas6 [Syntrophobacter fumaroxidans]|nr:CRISPR system precrRNA processing endoribonuclease RAMP protein Cas6 [Syntrophobacter fumaroxidans]